MPIAECRVWSIEEEIGVLECDAFTQLQSLVWYLRTTHLWQFCIPRRLNSLLLSQYSIYLHDLGSDSPFSIFNLLK